MVCRRIRNILYFLVYEKSELLKLFYSAYYLCILAKFLQLCLTLCNPTDCSLPESSVCGTLQTRKLSGLPFLPPGDLPNLGIEPTSLISCVGRQTLHH